MRHIARHTKTNAKHPGLQWHGCTLTHRSEELTQHTCCSIVTDTTPNFNFDFASVLQSNVSCNKVLEVLLNSLPSLMRPARTKHLESFIIERVIFTSCNKPRARLIPSELNVSRHNKFPHKIWIGHSWESGCTRDMKRLFVRNVARHPDPAQETRRKSSTFHC